MKTWFQKRGYPENIENEMEKVKFPSCNKIQRKKSKGIPCSYLSPSFKTTRRDITLEQVSTQYIC